MNTHFSLPFLAPVTNYWAPPTFSKIKLVDAQLSSKWWFKDPDLSYLLLRHEHLASKTVIINLCQASSRRKNIKNGTWNIFLKGQALKWSPSLMFKFHWLDLSDMAMPKRKRKWGVQSSYVTMKKIPGLVNSWSFHVFSAENFYLLRAL